MFNVSTHKIQWKEKEWSLYVPEYCDLAYKVFDIEKLKCFQPLGIKRSLEIIDINGKNRVSKSIMNMMPLTNNESTISTKLIMLKKLTNTIRNHVKY